MALKLLIIDEIWYICLLIREKPSYFQVIVKRYEKSQIILTSHLPFGQWNQTLYKRRRLNIRNVRDTFSHHSHIIQIKGESYRLK